MTQRLALQHILTTQLAKNWEREDAEMARLASQEAKKDKLLATLRTIHVPARYQDMMPDTRKTYDNMVARIHQTMQSVRPKKRPLPAVALPDAAMPAEASAVAPPLPSTLVAKNYPKRGSRSGRVRGGGSSSKALGSTTKSSRKPLALIRAGLNLKMQRAKSGGGEMKNPKGYAVQMQMNEVLRQKNMLETMLMQHQRLRHDRQTIVTDMKRMRLELDQICHKLDTSLQSLNSTRTLSSTAPMQAKEAIQKMVSHRAIVRHKAKTGVSFVSNNKARKSGTQKKISRTVIVGRSGILKAKTNPTLRNRQRLHAN